MKIRNKILIYFSSTVIALSAFSLALIYLLFYEYREEEFQQQQNEKIKYTVGLVTEFKQMSEELAQLLDAQDIHDFYDEKLLIFNSQKELIFSSLDSLPIAKTKQILNNLSPATQWVETKEEDYDLVGVYVENKGKTYYGISKAYDASGYSKLYFLRNVLIGIFISISVVVILVSLYLSNIISKPITKLAEKLNNYNLGDEHAEMLTVNTTSYELEFLTERFNELLGRTKEAFAFQKNAINHISHELKTPIAVLVSEMERAQATDNEKSLKSELEGLTNQAKSLGEIINVLLEISKIESGQELAIETVRLDEIILDSLEDLQMIYPDFFFDLNFHPTVFDEEQLNIRANRMLIKQAIQNLLLNAISYSSTGNAEILIDCSESNPCVRISNKGAGVSREEAGQLFRHSFRGQNSSGKIGFGLGLVLAKKIFDFHHATIKYQNPTPERNEFEICF